MHLLSWSRLSRSGYAKASSCVWFWLCAGSFPFSCIWSWKSGLNKCTNNTLLLFHLVYFFYFIFFSLSFSLRRCHSTFVFKLKSFELLVPQWWATVVAVVARPERMQCAHFIPNSAIYLFHSVVLCAHWSLVRSLCLSVTVSFSVSVSNFGELISHLIKNVWIYFLKWKLNLFVFIRTHAYSSSQHIDTHRHFRSLSIYAFIAFHFILFLLALFEIGAYSAMKLCSSSAKRSFGKQLHTQHAHTHIQIACHAIPITDWNHLILSNTNWWLRFEHSIVTVFGL